MEIEVTPQLAEPERRALLEALARAGDATSEDDLYAQAWRVAALREAAGVEAAVGYAFSPRSTRGATRA